VTFRPRPAEAPVAGEPRRRSPDVVAYLRDHAAPGAVIDGELISWDTAAGHTSFPALQRRVTAGRRLSDEATPHPAHLIAFDLLVDPSKTSGSAPQSVQRVSERRMRASRGRGDVRTHLR
jgi:ATP-dependent DNA ligase